MLRLPAIDPVAFQIGPFQVRWYGLMYLFGFVGGYFLVRWLANEGLKGCPSQLGRRQCSGTE